MAQVPDSFLALYDFAVRVAQKPEESDSVRPEVLEKTLWDRLKYRSRLRDLVAKIQGSEELRDCQKELLPQGLGLQSEGTISGGVVTTRGRGVE